MTRPVRVGTRGSLLARTQSGAAADAFTAATGRPWRQVIIRTDGDDLSAPLDRPSRPGVFVSALRDALLAGSVDIIIHSYKDLPSAPMPGVALAAVPPREDPRDVLISASGLRLTQLPAGAVLGTSSPRRAARISTLRPDLVIRPIRGNIDSRVEKVRTGEFDTTIMAAAGLARIGATELITQVFDVTEFIPAPTQGALAVECRATDVELLAELALLDHRASRLATVAERAVLAGVDAACTTAIGAHARSIDSGFELLAELSNHRGVTHKWVRKSIPGTPNATQAESLGRAVAAELLASASGR